MTATPSNIPPAFTCLRCGNCCRHPGEVRIDHGEADAIAASLNLDVITFTSRYTRLRGDRLGLSLLDQEDGACVFLASGIAGYSCRIQDAKPRQCREFPSTWRYDNMHAVCRAVSPPAITHQPLAFALEPSLTNPCPA